MRPGQRPPERRRSSVIGYNRTAKVVIFTLLNKWPPQKKLQRPLNFIRNFVRYCFPSMCALISFSMAHINCGARRAIPFDCFFY